MLLVARGCTFSPRYTVVRWRSSTHPGPPAEEAGLWSSWAWGRAEWGTPGQEEASWRGPGQTQRSDSPLAESCWMTARLVGKGTCWRHLASGSEQSGGDSGLGSPQRLCSFRCSQTVSAMTSDNSPQHIHVYIRTWQELHHNTIKHWRIQLPCTSNQNRRPFWQDSYPVSSWGYWQVPHQQLERCPLLHSDQTASPTSLFDDDNQNTTGVRRGLTGQCAWGNLTYLWSRQH